MEDFVAAVKVFCQDQNWKGLGDYMNDSTSLISKNASKIDSAISALDPWEHTLGYLGLMVMKLSFPNLGDFELFFNQVQQLIDVGCPNQIAQGVDKFSYVCHCLVKTLVEQKMAFRGICLISKAIEKIQKCPSELTSLHADLMQLCLKAKCMKPGLKCLNRDITTLSPEMNKDAKSFLLYYHYGGMVYLAVKEYEKAMFFFQIAVTTPSMVLSHIMLEAYKKYVLLSVLLYGKYQSGTLRKFAIDDGHWLVGRQPNETMTIAQTCTRYIIYSFTICVVVITLLWLFADGLYLAVWR